MGSCHLPEKQRKSQQLLIKPLRVIRTLMAAYRSTSFQTIHYDCDLFVLRYNVNYATSIRLHRCLTLICTILLVEIDRAKICETVLTENWLTFSNEFINIHGIKFGIIAREESAAPSTLKVGAGDDGPTNGCVFELQKLLFLLLMTFNINLNCFLKLIHGYWNKFQ